MIDAYGATEGGVAVNRDAGMPAGRARPRARARAGGRRRRQREAASGDRRARPRDSTPRSASGEIVNTQGVGPFEGYYNNDEATEKTTRFGWYWSGDLGYKDAEGYLYFAGRNADWIRVDGENFPAGPDRGDVAQGAGVVVLAAVYGVPDDQAGDQVMAGFVCRRCKRRYREFARWLDAQKAIGPKWRPRYVRMLRDPPTTGTNKIVKRTLVHQKFRADRVGGETSTTCANAATSASGSSPPPTRRVARDSFVRYGRERFWDL